ncbi:MAG: LPXTG cell wall anchor domain-containing protein, partial [Gemmiger sp.]
LPTAGTAESCLGESLTVTADEPADTPLVQFISLTKGGKTLAQIKPGDYAIQYQVGPVNITRRALTGTITTGSAEKTYDGSALTEESYRQDNVTGLAGTDKIQVICTGSQTEIGSGENLCTITIVNAQGEDVTAYYDLSGLTVVPGTLTVTKAVPAPTDAPAPTDSHPEIARLIAEGKWGGTPTPAAAVRVPQTGDNFALTTVAAVMLAALAALVVVVVLRRRKHNRT